MEDKKVERVKLGFYRLSRAVEALAIEKRGKAEKTYLKNLKKCFEI